MKSEHRKILDTLIQSVPLPRSSNLESRFLEDLILRFDEDPKLAKRAMSKLIAGHGAQLFPLACEILDSGAASAAHEYLRSLLVESELVVGSLADPALYSKETATGLAKLWMEVEPLLDLKLLKLLFRDDAAVECPVDVLQARRVLDILSALAVGPHIVPLLLKLQRSEDASLRSKAILLFARASRNTRWAARRMADQDSRVRASVVEGLWDVDARDVLWAAAADAHHRVAANALVGLYHLDGLVVADRLAAMAASPEPMVRSAAGFAMGETRDPYFAPLLTSMIKDENTKVRGMALRSLIKIRKRAADTPAATPAPPEQPAAEAPTPAPPPVKTENWNILQVNR
jgi:hypothetical protein